MATIIVNGNVWSRVDEYYNNVEAKYPNTWDINDTTEQIEKIQQIIKNFESVSTWNREPMISSWKRMGWKETWDKNSNWHFAFDYNNTDGEDYIVIQDAEHQDNIKENNVHNKMKKIITESQLRNIIKESIKKVLNEDVANNMVKRPEIRYDYNDVYERAQDMVKAFDDLTVTIRHSELYTNENEDYEAYLKAYGNFAIYLDEIIRISAAHAGR